MSELDCRGCGEAGLQVVLSLGAMPPSNALLTEQQLTRPEPRYPLELAFCEACSLAQITVSLDPEALFTEYAYFSSYSTTMLEHAGALAKRLIDGRNLGSGSLVMEIASNDGYLLQNYVRAGVPVLGIDPARNVVRAAEERNVETLCTFFGMDVARELRDSGRTADVIHANNVLAHVPDVNGVVAGMATVLKDDGIAVIETPYVRDLIERLEFDTIYHEHLFYYSATSLGGLLRRNGLVMTDVERIPIHGGSLRVFAAREASNREPDEAVRHLLQEEEELGISTVGYYTGFAERVDDLRERLTAMLLTLRGKGDHIAAYGAAAKGAVLLNAFGIGADLVDFVVDRSTYKQGKYMPGIRIPIVAPERLLEDMPDEVLLLAWNFVDEILEQQSEYRERGGRFIIPAPEPMVV